MRKTAALLTLALIAVACTPTVHVVIVTPAPYDCYANEVENHRAVLEASRADERADLDAIWGEWHANDCPRAEDNAAVIEATQE